MKKELRDLIDCHTRLNRIAALDGNILNFGLTQNETNADHDDELETIASQCRSWIENADSFEKLGRYEARISRQLLQYTKELERLKENRRCREAMDSYKAEQAEAAKRQAEKEAARQAAREQAEAARKAAHEQAEAALIAARQAAQTKPNNPELASFRQTPPAPWNSYPPAPQPLTPTDASDKL